MRTIRTKVYKFDELSKPAQQVAMDWWREGETYDYIYDEAWQSLKEFADLFDIKMRSYDFNEPYRSTYSFEMQDQILELSGQRLATYIWNNYKSSIFKGKYYNSWTSKKRVIHPKVESKIKSKETGWHDKSQWGEYWNSYHGIMLDNSCVLTGVCYDMDLLDPIYDFLKKPHNTDFKDLLEACMSSLSKSVRDEVEGAGEDENVADTIMANDYEFTKDGKPFHK